SFDSIENIEWKTILPDANHDWINQRDPNYQEYVKISGEEKSPFLSNAVGVSTNRDIWVSGFSKNKVQKNTEYMVHNYNDLLVKEGGKNQEPALIDESKVKWTRSLKNKFIKGERIGVDKQQLQPEMYRPFTKKWLYYSNDVIESPGQFYRKWGFDNQAIVTTGRGASRDFSVLVTKNVPCLDVMEKGQAFVQFDNEKNDMELVSSKDNV